MSKDASQSLIERPPVVAVMGHVDHGKSTLLDYIRKTNVVAGEAGGITQHISAYEVSHKNEAGVMKRITFLDTPGHEAFSNMRARGAKAADIAVLVVAADDGVKAQTKEVYETIIESKTPFIVAINKIDKPGANIEKTKNSLLEAGIYVEGYGGNISCVEVSAKNGDGIDNLLETILLTAELEELMGDASKPATGIVIESNLDEKRGISSTLVIKDGTLEKGMYVVVGDALAGTRIFEDFRGKALESALFSSPISITGFTSPVKIFGLVKVPQSGETFYSFKTKREAEDFIEETKVLREASIGTEICNFSYAIPIIIKTDVLGSNEVVQEEVRKICTNEAGFKIIRAGVGDISESDLTFAQADKTVIIIGFNTKVERTALEANEQIGATIKTFSIIYELTEWLRNELETRRPRIEERSVTASAKVLKTFNTNKGKLVFGGRVASGLLKVGRVDVLRNGEKIGGGQIIGLQQSKVETKEVQEGSEFGGMIEASVEIAPGDMLESYVILSK